MFSKKLVLLFCIITIVSLVSAFNFKDPSSFNFPEEETTTAYTTDARFDNLIGNCTAGNFILGVSPEGYKYCDAPAGSGDITAVFAGLGLTGGGESGDVTLNINDTWLNNTIDARDDVGGNPFDQSLNTTDNVTFNNITATGNYSGEWLFAYLDYTNVVGFDERVQDLFGLGITGGVGITATYDDPTGVLDITFDCSEATLLGDEYDHLNCFPATENPRVNVSSILVSELNNDLSWNNNTYTAGSNLTLTGTEFSINITSLKAFFDTIYAAIGDLFSGSWNDLTDVPAGFADGVDNDTNTWNTTEEMINAVNNSGYLNVSINYSNVLNHPSMTDTNCNSSGSCSSGDVAYMDYNNTGDFNITGNFYSSGTGTNVLGTDTNITGDLTVTQNITISANNFICMNSDCSSYIFFNSTDNTTRIV